MSPSTVYEDDILEWSEHQAAALRRIAELRPDISNEIDWENVAEEIEGVGRSEFSAVQSLIRQIFVHLIKAISAPEASAILHWRSEALAFHHDLLDRITPSMRTRIDLAKLWRQALVQAEADLAARAQALGSTIPAVCPFHLADIVDREFDFLALVKAERARQESEPPAC